MAEREGDAEARLARLERSMRRVKVALVALLLCVVFPAVAGAASAVLFVVGVAGGVMAFIVLVMSLLEWCFGGEETPPWSVPRASVRYRQCGVRRAWWKSVAAA